MKKLIDGELVDLTKQEIEEKEQDDIKNLEHKNQNLWLANRLNEYPSVQECVHALLDGGDTLTELQEKRQAVKTKYPKPE